MSIISRDKNQINCIYANYSDFGRQLEGYLKSSDKDVLLTDIRENMPSTTQWQEIADNIDTDVNNLLDYSQLENADKESKFNVTDFAKILEHNPKALRGAIIINGNKVKHITNITKVLEYFKVDSAGLEKTLHTEKPVTQRTTNKDNFI